MSRSASLPNSLSETTQEQNLRSSLFTRKPNKKSGKAIDYVTALPREIQCYILSFLCRQDLRIASQVCAGWRILIKEHLWASGSGKLAPLLKHHGKGARDYCIVLIGSGAVGKQAFASRFIKGQFIEKYDPVIEDSYRKQMLIDSVSCMLEIVVTAGQEEYSALRDSYILRSNGILIFYSIVSTSSFEYVQRLYAHSHKLLEQAQMKVPIILIGSKCDLEDQRQISFDKGQALANKWNDEFHYNFFETSAKNNINVDKVVFEMVRQIDAYQSQKREKVKKRKDKCRIS